MPAPRRGGRRCRPRPQIPVANASRARPAGKASDLRPSAASHAAPMPQPTAKPIITGRVRAARLRALATSAGSPPSSTLANIRREAGDVGRHYRRGRRSLKRDLHECVLHGHRRDAKHSREDRISSRSGRRVGRPRRRRRESRRATGTAAAAVGEARRPIDSRPPASRLVRPTISTKPLAPAGAMSYNLFHSVRFARRSTGWLDYLPAALDNHVAVGLSGYK